jgi:hypothetical protein
MTERPRDARFALINVAFLADPKFVRLARNLSRERFNEAVGVWIQLLCAARQAKHPAIDWEDWADDTQAIADLRQARLLNVHGFDQETFDAWGPKRTYPSDLLRKATQDYAPLRTPTVPSLSQSHSSNGYVDKERDAAESRVVMRSPEEREAELEKQRKLLSHPHPAVAKAAERAIRELEKAAS